MKTKRIKALRDKYLPVLLVMVFCSVLAQAQVYQKNPNRFQYRAVQADSTLRVPYGPIPSLRDNVSIGMPGAIFYRTTDSNFYYYTGSQWQRLKVDSSQVSDAAITTARQTGFPNVASMMAAGNQFRQSNGIYQTFTQGYYSPSDGGGAIYRRNDTCTAVKDSSFHVPGGTGCWELQLTSGRVNFLQVGGRFNSSSAGNGQANDWVLQKVLNNPLVQGLDVNPSRSGQFGYVGGAMAGNTYYFADTIRITRPLVIDGGNINTTVFYAPKGVIYRVNASPIKNLTIIQNYSQSSESYNSSTKHGIFNQGNGNQFIRVRMIGFSGDGFNTNGQDYNSNNTVLDHCESWYNGRHGEYAYGADANNYKVDGGDYSYNARWGNNYNGFLQGEYNSVHNASNTQQHPLNKSIVSYSGSYYVALQDNINVTPGTNAAVWELKAFSPTYSSVWASGVNYFSGGAYTVSNVNAQVAYNSCYVEPDQNVFIGNGRELISGGELAIYAKGVKIRGFENYATTPRLQSYDNVTENKWRIDAATGKMSWLKSGGNPLSFAGYQGGIELNYADVGAGVNFTNQDASSGTNTALFGTSTYPLSNEVGLVSKHLFAGINGLGANLRLGYATATPTVGWHQQGEFLLYAGTDATIIGYRCTIAGTPGTWITINKGTGNVNFTDTARGGTIATYTYVDSLFKSRTASITTTTTSSANLISIPTLSGSANIIEFTLIAKDQSNGKVAKFHYEVTTTNVSGVLTIKDQEQIGLYLDTGVDVTYEAVGSGANLLINAVGNSNSVKWTIKIDNITSTQ